MPLAIEQFDFSEYDLVISISASFAKGIITKSNTKHICYCLTPPRFLWDESQKLVDEFNFPKPIKTLIPLFISYLRIWDREASLRPDEYWSISSFIKERVKKYYGQESSIIYPPVNVNNFSVSDNPGDYFLMVGRLVPYKKFDIAVNVFNELGLPLKIVGGGPEMAKLKRKATHNIEFLGLVTDSALAELYSASKALIFPQEEDFGITALESMASGRPVIAYGKGGALESIKENESGVFFDKQTPESLVEAVKQFQGMSFDSKKIRMDMAKFDRLEFRKKIVNFLNRKFEEENKLIIA